MISVIKLGGSLLQSSALGACLEAIAQRTDNVVIVPGGGMFAEQVRIAQQTWLFDDVAAHRMAILAMQQMALLINSLKPKFSIVPTVELLPAQHISVWSPQVEQLDAAGIAASWEVTSDSLAAWLAKQIDAEQLILIKSAAVAADSDLSQLQQLGIVDAAFLRFVDAVNFTITVINHQDFLSAA